VTAHCREQTSRPDYSREFRGIRLVFLIGLPKTALIGQWNRGPS
jgi:hypothetical protein